MLKEKSVLVTGRGRGIGRVITVSPSAVDTPERGNMRDRRLQADAVVSALNFPQRSLVRDMELWATKP